MAAIKDGGPAFPLSVAEIGGTATHAGEFGEGMTGMSLRDYFAAHAMTAIGRTYIGTTEHGEIVDMLGQPTFKEEARRCYEFADAMLAERDGEMPLRQQRDELLDALRGMVGLVQLIAGREPDLQSNHRFVEALAAIARVGGR